MIIRLEIFNQIFKNKDKKDYKISKQIFTTYSTGLIASIISLPLWTLRLRFTQLSFSKKANILTGTKLSLSLVKESFSSFRSFLSLYRGIIPNFYLSFQPTIQLTIYQTIKNKSSSFNSVLTIYTGAISNFITSVIVFPLTFIKSKQQQLSSTDSKNNVLVENLYEKDFERENYSTIRKSVKTIYQRNGFLGFYRGYLPVFLRSILRGGIFFFVFENSNTYFNKK